MVKIALFLLIWGCFALRFPVILVAGIGMASITFVVFQARAPSIPRALVLVLANIGYWTFSGFASGGMALADLSQVDYWSGEGRSYISYIPLALTLAWKAPPSLIPWLMNQLRAMAVVGFLLAVVWMVTKTHYLSVGTVGQTGLFSGLQTSHTGTGMLWGTVSTVLLIYGLSLKRKTYVWAGLLAVLPLIGSASREGLLGLVLAAGFWFYRHKGMRQIWMAVGVGSVFTLLMLFVGQTFMDRLQVIFNVGAVTGAFEKTMSQSGGAVGSTVGYNDAGLHNIEMRFLLWHDAFQKWESSPVCGIGSGRYNDSITGYYGLDNVCRVADAGTRNFAPEIEYGSNSEVLSTGNAHNTYFQLLAEIGLIGFSLFAVFWIYIWRRLTKLAKMARNFASGASWSARILDGPDAAVIEAFADACQGAILFTTVGACFGNAWMSPSSMVVMAALIGVGEAVPRWLVVQSRSIVHQPDELSPGGIPSGVATTDVAFRIRPS